jgi:uncharacterized membrane protein YGL010W
MACPVPAISFRAQAASIHAVTASSVLGHAGRVTSALGPAAFAREDRMSFLAQQLSMYARYHRDPRNRATHFVGIPAIVFSILVPLALWRFPLFGLDASAAWIVAAIAVAGWIALDVTIGLAMLVAMAVLLFVAEWIATRFGTTTAWVVFALFFVGGWILQLIGHLWEGKRPAFADNLFQAFIGPMFLIAEVLIALGLKQDLKAVVEESSTRVA